MFMYKIRVILIIICGNFNIFIKVNRNYIWKIKIIFYNFFVKGDWVIFCC